MSLSHHGRGQGLGHESYRRALAFLRDCAGQAAFGLRSLFNAPEATALIRGQYDHQKAEPYWRRVLQYSVDGCLQAVMDEYVHVLRDSLGLEGTDPWEAVGELSHAIAETASLRTASMRADEFRWDARKGAFHLIDHAVRGHFALRFGDNQSDDGDHMRPTLVRDAFNSPFRPFVLATTSVGQEGLGFHHYCHAVVHWDLPANPVDLEQREGRVHRYKGYAVRKNVALVYGRAAMAAVAADVVAPDVWRAMFQLAEQGRNGNSQLVPYWIFPVAGGASVERHVPALPLSRDVERLAALKRSLAVYRMVFGQAQHEDLVAFLLEHVPEHKLQTVLRELAFDLRPP